MEVAAVGGQVADIPPGSGCNCAEGLKRPGRGCRPRSAPAGRRREVRELRLPGMRVRSPAAPPRPGKSVLAGSRVDPHRNACEPASVRRRGRGRLHAALRPAPQARRRAVRRSRRTASALRVHVLSKLADRALTTCAALGKNSLPGAIPVPRGVASRCVYGHTGHFSRTSAGQKLWSERQSVHFGWSD